MLEQRKGKKAIPDIRVPPAVNQFCSQSRQQKVDDFWSFDLCDLASAELGIPWVWTPFPE